MQRRGVVARGGALHRERRRGRDDHLSSHATRSPTSPPRGARGWAGPRQAPARRRVPRQAGGRRAARAVAFQTFGVPGSALGLVSTPPSAPGRSVAALEQPSHRVSPLLVRSRARLGGTAVATRRREKQKKRPVSSSQASPTVLRAFAAELPGPRRRLGLRPPAQRELGGSAARPRGACPPPPARGWRSRVAFPRHHQWRTRPPAKCCTPRSTRTRGAARRMGARGRGGRRGARGAGLRPRSRPPPPLLPFQQPPRRGHPHRHPRVQHGGARAPGGRGVARALAAGRGLRGRPAPDRRTRRPPFAPRRRASAATRNFWAQSGAPRAAQRARPRPRARGAGRGWGGPLAPAFALCPLSPAPHPRSLVEMLYCTSLLAVVGAGEQAHLSPRRVSVLNTAERVRCQNPGKRGPRHAARRPPPPHPRAARPPAHPSRRRILPPRLKSPNPN